MDMVVLGLGLSLLLVVLLLGLSPVLALSPSGVLLSSVLLSSAVPPGASCSQTLDAAGSAPFDNGSSGFAGLYAPGNHYAYNDDFASGNDNTYNDYHYASGYDDNQTDNFRPSFGNHYAHNDDSTSGNDNYNPDDDNDKPSEHDDNA